MKTPNEVWEMIGEITARLDLYPCHRCDGCGTRCVDGIRVTQAEFTALVDYLTDQSWGEVQRVIGQDKNLLWGARPLRLCLYRDRDHHNCFVYPVRPLICRLFGFLEWLPCPLGKTDSGLPDGSEILYWYYQFERRTFQEWTQTDERMQRLLRGGEIGRE